MVLINISSSTSQKMFLYEWYVTKLCQAVLGYHSWVLFWVAILGCWSRVPFWGAGLGCHSGVPFRGADLGLPFWGAGLGFQSGGLVWGTILVHHYRHEWVKYLSLLTGTREALILLIRACQVTFITFAQLLKIPLSIGEVVNKYSSHIHIQG